MIVVGGGVHVLLFAVLYAERYAGMVRDGLVDTVDGDDQREAAFWTMGFGLLLLAVGSLLHAVQSRLGALPALPGWIFLVLGLGGGVLMPFSPFWLGVPVGLSILRAPRPVPTTPAAPVLPAVVRHGRVAAPS